MNSFGKKSEWKGFINVVLIAAIILAIILALFQLHTVRLQEYHAELADLYAMYDAELTVKKLIKDKHNEFDGYWFDPDSYALLPDSEELPTPSGHGTKRKGGAVADFVEKTGAVYKYDEDADYRNMALHVTAGDDISVEWVSCD